MTVISVSVMDNHSTTTETFELTVSKVDDLPFISPIDTQTTKEDIPLRNIKFLADEGGDLDEDNQILHITATSSNRRLVPDENIIINFSHPF